MSSLTRFTAFALAGALAFGCLGLAACAPKDISTTAPASAASLAIDMYDTTGGVAASVNDVEIGENAVNAFIANMRVAQNLTSDEAWANYLAETGMTYQDMRESILDYFVTREELQQACDMLGIEADVASVQSMIDSMVSSYGSEEAFEASLMEAMGVTTAQFKFIYELRAYQEALLEALSADAVLDDETRAAYLASYAQSLDGAKRSSHILFDINDKATAEQVLADLKAGKIDFADAAAQHSLDGSGVNGGDVGWDKAATFVPEYQGALDELSVGDMSDLVESQFGYHIILCTDEFNAPEEITSVEQFPEDFQATIESSLNEAAASHYYSDWLTNYEGSSNIIRNAIPESVPYAV